MQVDVRAVAARHVSEILSLWKRKKDARDYYPSMLINFKSPPKYRAYKRDIGNP